MGSTAIIAAIDKELARLHDVRAKIVNKEKTSEAAKGRGPSSAAPQKAKRQLSPAARGRIAEAQRKRWAAVRKEKRKGVE
jgi:hypothetical protein